MYSSSSLQLLDQIRRLIRHITLAVVEYMYAPIVLYDATEAQQNWFSHGRPKV